MNGFGCIIYVLNTTDVGIRQMGILRERQPEARIFVQAREDILRRYQGEIERAKVVPRSVFRDADELAALLG